MSEQLNSADYYDIVETLGREHLLQLDRAVENAAGYTLEGPISASSHDITPLGKPYNGFEHRTTYRQSVFADIDGAILGCSEPPRYVSTIVSALTSALIDHTNMHHRSSSTRMKPDADELNDQLSMIWLSYQQPQVALTEEAVIYSPSERYATSLTIARHGGKLALDYVWTHKFVRLRC